MDANLAVEQALDDLERRLDSLEEKVGVALEQSTALLDYVKKHPEARANNRTVTRRIILEETTVLPRTLPGEA